MYFSLCESISQLNDACRESLPTESNFVGLHSLQKENYKKHNLDFNWEIFRSFSKDIVIFSS